MNISLNVENWMTSSKITLLALSIGCVFKRGVAKDNLPVRLLRWVPFFCCFLASTRFNPYYPSNLRRCHWLSYKHTHLWQPSLNRILYIMRWTTVTRCRVMCMVFFNCFFFQSTTWRWGVQQAGVEKKKVGCHWMGHTRMLVALKLWGGYAWSNRCGHKNKTR